MIQITISGDIKNYKHLVNFFRIPNTTITEFVYKDNSIELSIFVESRHLAFSLEKIAEYIPKCSENFFIKVNYKENKLVNSFENEAIKAKNEPPAENSSKESENYEFTRIFECFPIPKDEKKLARVSEMQAKFKGISDIEPFSMRVHTFLGIIEDTIGEDLTKDIEFLKYSEEILESPKEFSIKLDTNDSEKAYIQKWAEIAKLLFNLYADKPLGPEDGGPWVENFIGIVRRILRNN